MKIKLSYLLLVLAGLFFISNSSNPPNGRTGAPGDNGACNGCHSGGFPGIDGEILITGIPNNIEAGQTYGLTLTLNNTTNNAARGGFQMVVLDSNNDNVGQLSNSDDFSTISISSGRDYFEHAPAQDFVGGTVSYTVDWTAPENGTISDGDNLTFYAAGVIANGNSSTSGDFGPTTSLSTIYNEVVTDLELMIEYPIDPSCTDGTDGSATVVIAGGTAPYSILWSSGETSPNAVMLAAGNNTVTVTDDNGLTAETNIELGNPPAIEISAEVQSISCLDASDGAIELSVSGGTGDYAFLWSTDSTTFIIQDLSSGTYSVTVTDENGCTSEEAFDLVNPAEIVNTLIGINDEECEGIPTGSIFVTSTGGTGELSFLWSDGSTNQNLINVLAGDYTLTATDENSCSLETTYTIANAVDTLTVDITATSEISCNGQLGSLEANVNVVNATYLWNNGVTDQQNNDVVAGFYEVTVTSENGCTATTSLTLLQPDSLTSAFELVSPSSTTDGSIASIPAGGTSPYSYLWSTGSSDSLTIVSEAGIYGFTLTDTNNCVFVDSIEVSVTCEISLSVDTVMMPSCFGLDDGSISIDISGAAEPVEILWSEGSVDSIIENLKADIYTVTVTDDYNCIDSLEIMVTQPAALSLSFDVIQQPSEPIPNGGIIEAIASGGKAPYQYFWSTSDTTSVLDSLTAAIYLLEIVDSNGCFFVDSVVLDEAICNVNANISYEAIPCSGDSTSVKVNIDGAVGNVVYEWSTGSNLDTQILPSGSHFVAAVDVLGCADTVFFDIDQPDILELDSFYVSTITCEDTLGSIYVQYTGGSAPYEYLWSNGSIFQGLDSLIVGGTYVVTITDANFCQREDSIVVTESFASVITFQMDTVLVYLDSFGIFNDLPEVEDYINQLTGGCADSLYLSYDTLQINCNDLGLIGYDVSLFNYEDLIETRIVAVQVIDTIAPTLPGFPVIIDLNETNSLICGAQTIFGSIPLSSDFIDDNCEANYLEDSLSIFIVVTDEPGEYSEDYEVVVEDQSGNTSVGIVTVSYILEEQPTVELVITDVSCFGASDGCIEVIVEGGVEPIEVLSNGLCDINAGNYFFIVENGDGCQYEFEETVNEPEEIVISVIDQQGEIPGESDGFIIIDVTGGVAPFTYSWRENNIEVSTNKDLINFPSSQYELVVTDNAGCQKTFSTFIDVASIQSNLASEIRIFPNPFSRSFIIKGVDLSYSVYLTNLIGERFDVQLSTVAEGLVVDIEELIPGIYVVEVQRGTKRFTKKIIKI